MYAWGINDFGQVRSGKLLGSVCCGSVQLTLYTVSALTKPTAYATTHVGLLTVVPNVANAQMFKKLMLGRPMLGMP